MKMTTSQWIEAEKQWNAANYHPLPVVLTRGEGVWVWDHDGKRYMDMMSAYSAVSHGHGHPRLKAALKAQMDRLCIASRAFHHDQFLPFIEKLCTMAQLDQALVMNTGVEAVETAVKAARRWGYLKKGIPEHCAEILVAENNFHGRTVTAISFSTEPAYRANFGPFTPGFRAIPFGDSAALEAAITPNTCAFLVEPMQGESGIRIPPAGWLKQVETICRKHNVLLLLDEIQTGLGRTGALFAHFHEGVRPDGLIVGKALGGGLLPVSAFIAPRAVMEVFTPGSHGSTFGGNALACAVGLAALEVIEEEGLVERSRTLGDYFIEQLKNISHPAIIEVRGKGLWVGVEIDPARVSSRKLSEAMLAAGFLVKDVHGSVLRFAPPLVIEKQQIDEAVAAWAQLVQKMER